MAYTPRGKVAALVEAMRAEPDRIWTSADVAHLMDVQQAAVTAHLDSAIRNQAIYRKLENGRCQYSPKPFPAEPAVEVPQFIPYVPPKMSAPRPGSDVRHVNPPRPGSVAPVARPCPGCERQSCENSCVSARLEAATTPSPTPAVWTAPPCPIEIREPACAPVPPAAVCREIHREEIDQHDAGAGEESEAVEPDAFLSCRTGEIVLIGIDPDEDGRVVIPADLVALIKRQIAWSPGR